MSKMVEDVVTVQIELGHKADFKPRPSPEGFTHDWMVFVRGPDGTNIQHYVEKVVFHLHDTFKNPKRVVTEPPYAVSESGYAGFLLPIEIFFRNKQQPRKIRFEYDLYLNGEGAGPVNNKRHEKLKFSNPSEDFRQKLLKAGAVSSIAAAANQPFMDLFGPPIKTSLVDSPKKHKNKDKDKSYSRGKHSPATSNSSSTSEKDSKSDSHIHVSGKDISNSISAPQKDRDVTASSQRDKEGFSSSSKDRENTSSHKDSSSSSLSQRSSSSAREKERDSTSSSSHKDKDTLSHKDYKGGGTGLSHKEKNGFKKSSSSSGHRETSSSSAPLSSSTSHGQKSSSSFYKSSHRDIYGSSVKASPGKDVQGTTDMGSSLKEGSSNHKKKSKDKAGRDKESGESTSKRALEPVAMGDNPSTKKRKLDSKNSSSKSKSKSEHDKSSSKDSSAKSSSKNESSKPPKKKEGKSENSKMPEELDSRSSSATSSKRKSIEKRVADDIDKKGESSKKTCTPALMQRRPSNSSVSSEVSTVSSLQFTDEEEERPGLDISNLMADLGSPSDKEQNSKPKPKLASPAPSSPVPVHSGSLLSKSKTSKMSSSSISLKKKSPPSPVNFSNNASSLSSSRSLKPSASTSSTKKKSPNSSSSKNSRPPSSSTDKTKEKKISSDKQQEKLSKESKAEKCEPKTDSPQALPPVSRKESQSSVLEKVNRVDKKKNETTAPQKALKVERKSSEEEGELSSSLNLSDSSDEEMEMVVNDDRRGNSASVSSETVPPQADPSNVGAPDRRVSVDSMHHMSHENGGLFYKDDLADNGYTLWSLVLLQKEIESVSEPSVLQEIAELVFDSGKSATYDDTFEFDLCAMEKDVVDKIRDIVSQHHRNP
ncbi:protein AF-9-like isoform X2 [Pomacea canaliculata]|uniref:protein AF-9-like isoform X2 n=1 Tax=Pomacea canaliculata TaxID=400727 RepID=UPI000D72CE63|nr:protein AF-9-like isoform X2 [Pomacea canaliculata]